MIDSATVSELAARIVQLSKTRPPGMRFMVGIAGYPAAGKSIFADLVTREINRLTAGAHAVSVPMDGFHKKNWVLVQEGASGLKGKPETFEVQAFLEFLRRVRRFEKGIRGPAYSRERHDVIDDAYEIGDEEIAIVEGNYLFLDKKFWADILGLLDFKIFLGVNEQTALRRLYQRQLNRTHSAEQARWHVAEVDLPNIRLVEVTRRRADIILEGE